MLNLNLRAHRALRSAGFLVILLAVMVSEALADSTPLANQYTGSTPANIRITARMKGVAFSLDNTTWDLTGGGGLEPNEVKISGRYVLQNDGGVNIDLSFNVGDSTTTGRWGYKPSVTLADDATYPVTDQYYVEPYVANNGDPTPTIASFTGTGLTDTYTEATSALWAHNRNARTTGVNLPAYVPGHPDYDQVNLFLLFIAPASSTTDIDHTIVVKIQAKLAD